jgi:transcriptional regulator with XRE-family HTH domain
MLTPAQSRAARALVDWSQERLAEGSNLSESTVRDFEKGRRVPATNNLIAIRRALEEAGVEFKPDGSLRLREQPAEARAS